jgi:hypothetical protein
LGNSEFTSEICCPISDCIIFSKNLLAWLK